MIVCIYVCNYIWLNKRMNRFKNKQPNRQIKIYFFSTIISLNPPKPEKSQKNECWEGHKGYPLGRLSSLFNVHVLPNSSKALAHLASSCWSFLFCFMLNLKNLGKLKYFTELNEGRLGMISLTNHHVWWGRSEVVIIFPEESQLLVFVSSREATFSSGETVRPAF